jgi:hypothetical protein
MNHYRAELDAHQKPMAPAGNRPPPEPANTRQTRLKLAETRLKQG